MSESKLGLSPARSQPLWVQTQPGSREQGSPSRAGRTPGLLSASRLSRAGSPRSRRGARTLELRGCLWNPAPLASRVPRRGSLRDALSPGTAAEQGNCSPGSPGMTRGMQAGLPGSLSQRGECPFSISVPEGNFSCQTKSCRTFVKVRTAAAQSGWGGGGLAQGLPARGPRPLTSGE